MRALSLSGVFFMLLVLAIEAASAAAFESSEAAVSSKMPAQQTDSKIYVVELNSSRGSLQLDNITIEEDLAEEYERNTIALGGNWYECRIFSFGGRLLKRFFFEHPALLYWDSLDQNTGEWTGGSVPIYVTTLRIEYFPDAREINFYSRNGTLALSVDVSMFSDESRVEDKLPIGLTGFWRHSWRDNYEDNELYYICQVGNETWWLQGSFSPNGAFDDLNMVGYGIVKNYTLNLKYAFWPYFIENGTVVLDIVSEDRMEFREGILSNFEGSYRRTRLANG